MAIIKIHKPFTPSTIKSCKEIPMTEITISCGGGMGGSKWEEYTTDVIDLNNNFIHVNTNRCKDENINTRNIVKTMPVKVVELKVKNEGNGCMGPIGEIKTYYYVIGINDKIIKDDGYGENPKNIITFS